MKHLYTLLLFVIPALAVSLFLERQTKEDPKDSSGPPPMEVYTVEEAAPPPCNCNLTQGSFSSPLPTLTGTVSAATFYQYGVPTGSSANTGLEISNKLVLMLYEDTNTGEVSMVFIADIANDADGGQMGITFNCMPSTAYVAVSDDPGELTGSPPTFTGNFTWSPCCTDGGVIGNVGCGSTFTINPNLISGINDFVLVHGTVANPTYISMPNFDCPITINCGGQACCVEAFEFSGTVQNASCANSNNGSIMLTTNCATNPTFQWSNGKTTPNINNLAPGSYSVTITDTAGCTQSASYTVGANSPAPTPAITGPTSFCSGQTAVLGVNGSYSTYLWSNGQQTPSIIISTGGTYSVTVTNSGGCSASASINVTQNPSPTPTITGPTSICFGQTVMLSAGFGYSSYQWSTGANTPTLLVSQPGGYSVTVTNSFGCPGVAFAVVQPLPSPVPVISGPTSLCPGQTIVLDASGNFTAYNWSNGANTASIGVSTPGTYTVTVTNSSGCTASTSVNVTQSAGPTPTISGPNSFCPGDTVFLNADAGYSAYSWSSGQNIQMIQVTTPGLYTVTVTNSQGCIGSASLQVDTLASFTPLITGNLELCPGDTSFLDAGPGYTAYQWSTGDTTQTIPVAQAGLYEVTVTSTGSCVGMAGVEVIMNPVDTVLLYNTSCNPQDTGVFVATYSNQYGCDSVEVLTVSFALGDTMLLFSASCNPQDTGIFIQTFTNQDGCDSVEIETVSLLPTDTTYLFNTSCFPQDTGVFSQLFSNQYGCDSLTIETVTLNPTDSTYLYSASCNPQDTGLFINTLTNQYGCDSLIFLAVSYSESDSTYSYSASCNPQDTGLFLTTLTNQYGCDSVLFHLVSYSESDTSYTFGSSCSPLDTGLFLTTLTNQYGCDSLIFHTVSLLPTDTTYLYHSSCNPQDTGVFVFNYTNQYGCDSIEIETVSLLPSDTWYLYSESCNPQDTGVFVFNYTNQYGCDSIEIETVSLLPTDTVYLYNESCNPQDTGVFVFNYTNQYGCDSTEIETVSLLPSDTWYLYSESCNPQDTGVFVFNYTNQYGCDSIEIETVSLLPTDTVYLFTQSCNPQDTGLFVFNYTNQFGCDSIEIETVGILPTDTTYQYGLSCNPVDTGLFVFNFTNQYGCDSVVIETVSLLPSNTVYIYDVSCSPQDTGLFMTTYSNQFGCDSLVIETVSLLPSDTLYYASGTCEPSEVGTFFTSYSNQYGCDSTEVLNVFLLPTDSCALTVGFEVADILCNGENTGSISLSITGGNVPIQCAWMSSNGSLSGNLILNQFGNVLTIPGLPAGTYTVHLTDPNGLEWDQDITIDTPPPLTANVSVTSDFFGYAISCAGGADGSIEGSASGGVGSFSYTWSTGQSGTTTLSDLPAGAYGLTVTDGNGCVAEAIQVLNEPAPLVATLEVIPADCKQGNSLIVSDISGGIPPHLIALDGGAFSSQQQFDGLDAGTHTIDIEDAVACTWSDEATLPEAPDLWADLGPDTLIILGTSITLQLNTNLFPIDTIIWNPLPPGASCVNCTKLEVSPSSSTEYTVLVRDINGCEVTATVNVGVYRPQDFYVPNVISPNFDGINDLFVINAGKSVQRVRELVIFDRWGGTVFYESDFPPNDPAYGWDGRKNGQFVSEGVYVYQFEIEYVDGLVLLVSGDVAIVR
ncbi:MAG: gliding motility-associated C-terminal domain-containing protein [Lewinellaceae bacterium]|nr:gliding motility-associated C-terminal domain-containing protein [Lewinellaceae bacterium]